MASATLPAETKPQIHHIIDIPQQIEPVPDECCIYKVPHHLLKLNEESYTPQFISIGPLHSNKPELLKQVKQKQRYVHAFWTRLSNKQALAFVKYKEFLEENKEEIANCYSEPELCKEEDQFVGMILLDSVFIMELFLRKYEQMNDYMFTTSWVCKVTQRDLLLLENQLPMFVLEELHTRVLLLGDNSSKDNIVSFMDLAFNYFEDYYPHNSSQKVEMIKNCKSCKHFTDLIRYTYLPREIQANGVNVSPPEHFTPYPAPYYIPRPATKLNEAGVSFENVKGTSYLDMKFNKDPTLNWFLCFGCFPWIKFSLCRLQIPQFKVTQATTECVLRNLIAFEQCHYSDQPFICNYVSLIDSLIQTEEDVELLVEKEAIVNELGSHEELATLVNGLCKYVVVTSNYYGKITKELTEHYNSGWKRSMGRIKSACDRNSSVVGVIAFFLFTIYPYFY